MRICEDEYEDYLTTDGSGNNGQETMPATIIDILKRGNLELFHSAMIAWMCNPKEPNNRLKSFFLEGLLMHAGVKRCVDDAEITCEVPHGRDTRYDIQIKLTDGTKIIIENKTKSLGGACQLDRYRQKQCRAQHEPILIAMGLCEESFDSAVERCGKRYVLGENSHEYPFITYKEVLDILDPLVGDQVPVDAWDHLISQYRLHLRDVTELFEGIKRVYEINDAQDRESLATELRRHGDPRFMHEYFCARFCRYMRARLPWSELDARQIHFHSKHDTFLRVTVCDRWLSVSDEMKSLWSSYPAKYEIGLNLPDDQGVIADTGQECGMLRLTVEPDRDWSRRDFAEGFCALMNAGRRHLPKGWKRPSQSDKTFAICSEPICYSDLPFAALERKIRSFAESLVQCDP